MTDATIMWQQLSVVCHRSLFEKLSDGLTKLGAVAVTMAPTDGNTSACHADQVELTALFSINADCPKVCQTLQAQGVLPAGMPATIKPLANKNWVQETQQYWQAFSVLNRLWVVPSWDKKPSGKQACIKIDPGSAFGCGTHASTQLCLEWLAQQPLQQTTCLDFGCGSGILSFAAAALGAKHCIAYDICPDATQATLTNQTNNIDIAQHVTVRETLQATDHADIIIANMLAQHILSSQIALNSHLRPGGQLILSGLIDSDIERITAAFCKEMTLIDLSEKASWYRMVWQKAD